MTCNPPETLSGLTDQAMTLTKGRASDGCNTQATISLQSPFPFPYDMNGRNENRRVLRPVRVPSEQCRISRAKKIHTTSGAAKDAI